MKSIKIKIILYLLVFLGIIGVIFCYSYLPFKHKMNELTNNMLYIDVIGSFNDYLLKSNGKESIDKYKIYLKNVFPETYNQIIINNWKLDFIRTANDSIILYEYGFDGINDKAGKKITMHTFAYLNYLFDSKGDVVIVTLPLKGVTDEMENEKRKTIEGFKKFVSDSIK